MIFVICGLCVGIGLLIGFTIGIGFNVCQTKALFNYDEGFRDGWDSYSESLESDAQSDKVLADFIHWRENVKNTVQ